MPQKLSPVITGTLYLSAAGIVTRFLGFFYKVWLGNLIGAEELGIYQLVFPVFSICMAVCGGPFQTAVSKFTAEYQEHNPAKAKCILQSSLLMSITLSLLCAVFVLLFHRQIAAYFLLNDRCGRLLPYIAFALPLSAVHNCITGWYYGQKKTAVPAWANLTEQGIRILFVWFLVKSRLEFTVIQVVQALVAGELTSAFFTTYCCRKEYRKISSRFPVSSCELPKKSFHEISAMTWPLTANRLIMNLLQSVESVMIPSRLILSGIPESTALSMYGTLTGMSLSFILFPTALTGSFSLMLMPDIAKASAEHRYTYVRKASRLSLSTAFFIGCIFTAVFFLLGEKIGNLFYPGTLAGTYIRSLSWLCPFLYLNNILTSILHGMGMTALTFRTQLAGLVLRLGVTVFLIPLFGMNCYFTALLASQILMCGLNLFFLYHRDSKES
ncbi:MAG: oligosaccharide flippase family protein [Lachnospiraceae bacterium]